MDDKTDTAILVRLEYIQQGIEDVKTRLDWQNGQLRKHGEAIAVLHERTAAAQRAGGMWGAGAGAAVGGLLTALWHLFGGERP